MNASTNPLAGRVLGISISESPDLEALGFSEVHFRDALIEFARYMLAAGATIAYGGDFRAGGFTHTLFDRVSTYKGAGGSEAVGFEADRPFGFGSTAASLAAWVSLRSRAATPK